MEDFEYSIQICEKDWNSLFQACRECEVRSPTLAVLEDSGMSDIDDVGSVLVDRRLKADRIKDAPENDCPIDGPPDCEGSPVEYYLSKFGIRGMESVLSGSEEDIHLQCVNTYFEGLRCLTDAEQLTESSQVELGKSREAELSSDGPQASGSSALPENITKLNSFPANSETAAGREVTGTGCAKNNTNTMKQNGFNSNIVPEIIISNSDSEDVSACPNTELFIREVWSDTTEDEVRKQTHPHESPGGNISSVKTYEADVVLSTELDICKHLDGVKHGVPDYKRLEESKSVSLSFPTEDKKGTNKGSSPQPSPSPLIKKKRRKKKRDSGSGFERQSLHDETESDQEPRARLGRVITPCSPSQTSNIERGVTTVSNSEEKPAKHNLPLNWSSIEKKLSFSPSSSAGTCHSLMKILDLTESSVLKNPGVSDLSENHVDIDRFASPPGTKDGIMPTLDYDGHVATNLQPGGKLQVQTLTELNESPLLPVSTTLCTTSNSALVSDEIKSCLRSNKGSLHTETVTRWQSDKTTHTLESSCESETNSRTCATEEVSIIQLNTSQSGEASPSALGDSQICALPSELSASKSGLATEVGNSGRYSLSPCQRGAMPPQQLEMDHDYTPQYSFAFEKANFPMSTIDIIGSDTKEVSAYKTETFNRSTSALNDNPCQLVGGNSSLEISNSFSDKSCRPKSPRYQIVNNAAHQSKHSHNIEMSSNTVMGGSSGNYTIDESSRTVNQTPQSNGINQVSPFSMSEHLSMSQSHVMPHESDSTLEYTSRFNIPPSLVPESTLSLSKSCNTSSEFFLIDSNDQRSKTSQTNVTDKTETCNTSSPDIYNNPSHIASSNLSLENINSFPDKSGRPKSPPYSIVSNPTHQKKHSPEFGTSSNTVMDVSSGKKTVDEIPQTVNHTPQNKCVSEVSHKLSMSEHLSLRQPHVMPHESHPAMQDSSSFDVSSNQEPDSALSLSKFCHISTEKQDSSVSENDCNYQESKISQTSDTDKGTVETSGPEIPELIVETSKLECDSECKTEDNVLTSETEVEKEPDSKHSVFAMSSFWTEMEKLTIKDILGLRSISTAPPLGFLPPLPESEEVNVSDAADSGFITQLDAPSPSLSSGDTSFTPDVEELSPNIDLIVADGSSLPVGFMWESELDPVSLGAGIYPENMVTSISDLPQALSVRSQKCPKKMCKNTSVRNLQALESEPFVDFWTTRALHTPITEEGPLEMDYFTDEPMARQDSGMESLPPSSFTEELSTQSYGMSLTNIYQYLFGRKQSQACMLDIDNTVMGHIKGNSVPEMYDEFFSDFDSGSIFSTLTESLTKDKDETVPIFSCSRSSSKPLQFPDAYDHFFSSSSASDDSSGESDEDTNEDRRPIRVVTRFTCKANETQISTDIYDNFFTDEDIGQNFLWKNTFSLRKVSFASARRRETSRSLSPVPVKQSTKSFSRRIQPINMLGNHDILFPDPLLYHLDDRNYRQLAETPFGYDDLHTVANPRLDASLVPLKQSDMCLVCIAFASWVLKTSNPQIEDAWKAVLLANVSALSAIRYLRRYIRVAASGEKRLKPASDDRSLVPVSRVR